MTLMVNNLGDNPQQPGTYAEAYIPDQLIAGNLKLVTATVILGAGTLQRGTVLGQQTGAITSVAGATNVGNGTISGLTKGVSAEIGFYTLRATSPTVFSVTAPTADALPDLTVGTPYVTAGINLTITAGGTAFVAGDTFTVTCAASNYIQSVQTATDGSQFPVAILVDYADASGGPVNAAAYLMGEFNQNALIADPSWGASPAAAAVNLWPLLRPYGIFIKNAVTAADPS
ncbi:head decoration protein [Undibacterium sp. SXout20W]|uniref:head decoration protein n=1 Tax=Undibacterium sp. SXout20W TaxID=3413051 RepID=UPI003BF055FC